MTVAKIPSSLQRGIGAVALGNLRFVPDREGLLDSGPGYACFEATLDDCSIVRLSASIDPAQPTGMFPPKDDAKKKKADAPAAEKPAEREPGEEG